MLNLMFVKLFQIDENDTNIKQLLDDSRTLVEESNKARYVLAMVDRRLANKIKNKHDKGKDSKFFF